MQQIRRRCVMPNADPPPPVVSLPPSSNTKVRFEAYTDWFAIVALTVLVALDKVPWEWGVGIIGSIAGVAGVLKGMGRSGGAIALLAGPIAKLLGAKHGIHLLVLLTLGGCGTGITAGQAIKTVLPIAADALREIAAERGVEISESGAVCFEAPEIEVEQFEGVGIVALVCVAPYVE
jgi:hypothetical protein